MNENSLQKGENMKTRLMRAVMLTVFVMFSLANIAYASMPSISADDTKFDFFSGCYMLTGNVTVKTDSRVIKADRAKVSLASKEVWADGNIYLEEPDQQITFTGGSLYAADDTKTAVVKGGVKFERPDMTVEAEECSFNWRTKIAEFDDLVEVTRDGKKEVYNVFKYDVLKDKVIEAK